MSGSPDAEQRGAVVRQLGQRVRELIVATDGYRRTVADAIGVSTVEAALLGQLLHEGPLTPSEIAIRAGRTQASTTALIARLVSSDLVERTPHPRDRRSVLVELRPRGRAAIETTYALFAADLDQALGDLEDGAPEELDARDRLTDLLVQLASSLRSRAEDRDRVRAALVSDPRWQDSA
jgi:DNA-binding MarR family transcriptional regulator